MPSKSILEKVLRNYHEINELTKFTQDLGKRSELWLMILLKALNFKQLIQNAAEHESIIRSTDHPSKMALIDNQLEPICSNSPVINLLNTVRTEGVFGYFRNFCGVLGKSANDKVDKGVNVEEFIQDLFEEQRFDLRFGNAAEYKSIDYLIEKSAPKDSNNYKIIICRARDLRARKKSNKI